MRAAVTFGSSCRMVPAPVLRGVGVQLLAWALFPSLVQTMELFNRQIDLAAYFQPLRLLGYEAFKLQGYSADGAQVAGYVFPRGAIPSGRTLDEHAVFVSEIDSQTVYLQFAHHVERIIVQQPRDAPVPGGQFVEVEGVSQAEHRARMLDLGEGRRRLPSDSLRRRIGGEQLRVFRLDLPQFAQQEVVLPVADYRVVQRVVAMIVVVKLAPQLLGALCGAGVGHTGNLRPLGLHQL